MQLLGSKAFTGENNLLPIFLKVLIEMEPDLAHSFSTQLIIIIYNFWKIIKLKYKLIRELIKS